MVDGDAGLLLGEEGLLEGVVALFLLLLLLLLFAERNDELAEEAVMVVLVAVVVMMGAGGVVGLEWWSAGGSLDRRVTSSHPRDLNRCSNCAASLVPHASVEAKNSDTLNLESLPWLGGHQQH